MRLHIVKDNGFQPEEGSQKNNLNQIGNGENPPRIGRRRIELKKRIESHQEHPAESAHQKESHVDKNLRRQERNDDKADGRSERSHRNKARFDIIFGSPTDDDRTEQKPENGKENPVFEKSQRFIGSGGLLLKDHYKDLHTNPENGNADHASADHRNFPGVRQIAENGRTTRGRIATVHLRNKKRRQSRNGADSHKDPRPSNRLAQKFFDRRRTVKSGIHRIQTGNKQRRKRQSNHGNHLQNRIGKTEALGPIHFF